MSSITYLLLTGFIELGYLYPHGFGLDDVDLISVATPHLVMDYRHAADRVMRPPQIQQVVVGQIPLTVWKQQKIE